MSEKILYPLNVSWMHLQHGLFQLNFTVFDARKYDISCQKCPQDPFQEDAANKIDELLTLTEVKLPAKKVKVGN